MSTPSYPLAQLMEIKNKRVDEAEKALHAARERLEEEEQKYQELEAIRDRTKQHYAEKLTELRSGMDDGSATPEIITRTQEYLKTVKERLKSDEKKVQDQQVVLEKAEKVVEEAQALLRKRRKEVEKLEIHKKEWLKEVAKEAQRLQAIEMDDVGTVIFNARRRDG